MTTSSPVEGAHDVKCPACMQMTALREESLVIGTEILCRECGAILAVQQISPIVLVEVEPDDLD